MATPKVYKYRLQVKDRKTGEASTIERLSIYGTEKCVEIFKKYRRREFELLAIFKMKGTF
jgi:hypothetical protein